MKLSNENLSKITAEVKVPQYDRNDVTAGIVHFGVGGFHRAHQAKYLNDLMNKGEAHDYGILGVGIIPGADERMRDAMKEKDCLYTLVQKTPEGVWETEIIGSIIEFLYGPDNPTFVLEKMANPAIHIVSLTITEGGYNFDQITGDFIESNPDVQYDLVHEQSPRTVFAYIYRALKLRKERGIKPFTVMSCDNIQDNGAVVKKAILSFARLVGDEQTTKWIEDEVAFPSSMVDRITPRTTEEDKTAIFERYGIEDSWPVVSEDFIQWALTDDFTDGRPAYEKVGVQMVSDVMPYELMKLRLLNVSHQGIAYFGHLMGYTFVDDAAKDSLVAEFLLHYMNEEATPTLLPVPGINLFEYKKKLIERFSNASIRDTIARLAAESSDRIPKWLVPIINAQLENEGQVKFSAAIVASWARYAEGVDEKGNPIDVVDNAKEEVMAAAARQKEDPLAFLRMKTFFGELADNVAFTEEYLEILNNLHTLGARATLEVLVSEK
jgi:mannitol 2-dehydrogenase